MVEISRGKNSRGKLTSNVIVKWSPDETLMRPKCFDVQKSELSIRTDRTEAWKKLNVELLKLKYSTQDYEWKLDKFEVAPCKKYYFRIETVGKIDDTLRSSLEVPKPLESLSIAETLSLRHYVNLR